MIVRLIEESRLIQAVSRVLRAILGTLEAGLVGHGANWIAERLRESWILRLLFFGAPAWPEWTRHSSIIAFLRGRVGVSPEEDPSMAGPIRWALWALILYVPIELYVTTRLPTDVKYLSDLLIFGASLLVLARSLSHGWAYRATPLDLPIASLVAVGLLSGILNGESFKFWLFGMRAYLEYALVYFLVAAAPLTERDRRSLILGVVLMGLLMALVGVAQEFLHVATPRSWVGVVGASQGISTRVFGTMGNPNTYAGYLVMLISLLGALVVVNGVPSWLKSVATAGLLVALLSLLVTYSREALIGLFVAGCVIAIAGDARALIVLLLAASLAIIGDPKVLLHLASAFSQNYASVSLKFGRLYFWARSLLVISQHPLVGVGPGMFGGSVAYDLQSPVLVHYGLPAVATIDSEWLEVGAELGILGLLAYVWILSAIIRTSVTAFLRDSDPVFRAVSLGSAAAAAGFAVQSVFAGLFEVHQVVLMLWLLAGFAAWRWRVVGNARPAS